MRSASHKRTHAEGGASSVIMIRPTCHSFHLALHQWRCETCWILFEDASSLKHIVQIRFVWFPLLELWGQKGLRLIDLPVVMQAMFIIQLQIVPDKVLLGNRDTFTDRQGKVGEKITKVDMNIVWISRTKWTNLTDEPYGDCYHKKEQCSSQDNSFLPPKDRIM